MHGIDLDVEDGEFMVLVGPSGCAKSTTLRMIAGLETISRRRDPSSAIDVVNDLPPGKRGIAMVFQNYALYPHMKVRDNLAFGLKLCAARRKRRSRPRSTEVAEILEIERVARPAAQAAFRRSGAARRGRAGADQEARGLPVRRAAVEPRRQAARLDARAHHRPAPPAEGEGRSATVVYVTHDQTEAMTMGDRICVMKEATSCRSPTRRRSTNARPTLSSPASSAARR